MHDLDRTLMEAEGEGFELYGEGEGAGELFSEGELNEMAAELLSVAHEGELDHFLGDIFSKVAKAAGSFIKSPIGQALGGALKSVAKTALPIAGAALGNFVAPGIGGAIGGKLAGMAGSALGLELEGLSAEDREFETAKQFVRLAADAAQNTVGNTDVANAPSVAHAALAQAADKFAPGLLDGPGAHPHNGMHRHHGRASGRWIRRGNKIVIFGV